MGCCLLLKPPYRQAIGQKIDLLDVVRLLAVSGGRRCVKQASRRAGKLQDVNGEGLC